MKFESDSSKPVEDVPVEVVICVVDRWIMGPSIRVTRRRMTDDKNILLIEDSRCLLIDLTIRAKEGHTRTEGVIVFERMGNDASTTIIGEAWIRVSNQEKRIYLETKLQWEHKEGRVRH